MSERQCEACGGPLTPGRRRYCCDACAIAGWRRANPERHREISKRANQKRDRRVSAERAQRRAERKCARCGEPMPARGPTAKHCSRACTQAASHARNRDARNAAQRAYRAAHPERHRASNNAWNRANKDKLAESSRKHYARMKQAKLDSVSGEV